MTILVKILVLFLLRKKFYKAFYRKKPAAANFMNVIMEAWSVGLSLGYALARAVKLIAITAIFLGRIDTPFLDKGVGFIGGMPLDAYPYAFRKDLLLRTFAADEISLLYSICLFHLLTCPFSPDEAHRHPYLERLGCIYMLKLYHGPDFVSRAGSCWRLLFVVALMPWLRKYRVTNRFEVVDEESDGEFGDDEDDFGMNGREPTQIRRKSNVTRERVVEKDNNDLLGAVKEEHDEVTSLKEKLMALEVQLSQARALLSQEQEMRKAKNTAVAKLAMEIQKQRSALLAGSLNPSSSLALS